MASQAVAELASTTTVSQSTPAALADWAALSTNAPGASPRAYCCACGAAGGLIVTPRFFN